MNILLGKNEHINPCIRLTINFDNNKMHSLLFSAKFTHWYLRKQYSKFTSRILIQVVEYKS